MKKIKQLENDFTTPEQSKRLLELGMPADSANIGIIEDVMYAGIEILHFPYSEWCKGYESISLPCWSVGRLIKIYELCTGSKYVHTSKLSLFEDVLCKIKGAIKVQIFDFSKLED